MNEKKRNPVLRCFGIICAFWALILFGPALVMLINKFCVFFSGMGLYEDSFGYTLLKFFSQAIACSAACETAWQMSKNEHNVCVLINDVIAICVSVLSSLCSFFINGDFWMGVSSIVSAAVLIYYTVRASKEINTKAEQKEEEVL